MTRLTKWQKSIFCMMPFAFTFLDAEAVRAQANLQVNYGAKGVQSISYNGVTLEDVGAYPADSFHIWHMKSTDLNGNVLSAGQYGWGETNQGESWDPTSNTETYQFGWGTVATHFAQNGNNLDITVTETNYAGSGIIFDGAEVFPFALHFPQDPVGFYGYNQYTITSTAPGVSAADFGSGVVTSVVPNETVNLYGGWKTDGPQTYTPIMTATSPDSLALYLPHIDQPVQPGASYTYTISLRFTPEGTAADASDAYASFGAQYPSQMTWTDHRIIGVAYLASSPNLPDITQPGGYPNNPRRYFNDPTVDITTPQGLQTFQDRMVAQAATNVTNAQNMNAQGVVTWDLEGEQYSQSTTYVCSPDQIGSIAPEMESTITDPNSPFVGMKLDDAYFKTMTNAGLRVGVCIRPSVFTFGPNGTASQVFLPDSNNAAILANLENKARVANSRWGATMFYVDSNVYSNGGTLDASIYQQLITDLPSFLFIPEESTLRYYAYSAPFYSFIYHQTTGTPASIYLAYPNAFGATLINDVNPALLASYTPQITQSVSHGDILMGLANFAEANNATLMSISQAAGATKSAPPQSTPSIRWNAPQTITYGVALSGAQLNASANVAGSFTYSPAAGTLPDPGSNTLSVTFTPTDTVDYKSATGSVTLQVAQAVPVLSWPSPASIAAGGTLSGAQLNASANVPGSFSYNPGPGTQLQAGSTQLQVTFTPSDTFHYTSATASTTINVGQMTPSVNWSAPAPITQGTALSGAQLNASASVPGYFTYNPGPGTVLAAGTSTLQVTFTPYDTTDYTTQTAAVPLTVNAAAATPPSNVAILSPAPGATVSGTIYVAGYINLFLDAAGTCLLVDGQEVGMGRVGGAPFVYPLDTTTLSNGPHTIQLWGHDIGNNTTLSSPQIINVQN